MVPAEQAHLADGAQGAARLIRSVRCHEPRNCRANPLGVKGAGEAGTSGVGAAVANAVASAVGPAAARQLPVTAPRIKAALKGIDP